MAALHFDLGSRGIVLHTLIESLAYVVGFQIYARARKRQGDVLTTDVRLNIIVAAIAGAVVGSKVLAWFEWPAETLQHIADPLFLIQGKTIVGALLGGTAAVEWWKARRSITQRTGDLFGVPLAISIAVGRLGCFCSGLNDRTYGVATTLPWGVDLGDGIARHPTQIYEVLAMIVLAIFLHRFASRSHQTGDIFRLFLISYLGWRLVVDFLKPDPRWGGLTVLQWTCVAGLCWYARDLIRILRDAQHEPTSSTISVL